MNLSIRKLLFILAFTIPLNSSAFFVDHMKVQAAGEIGLLAFGLGKKISETYSFDILYGYVPESIGNQEIETYAFKNYYNMYDFSAFKQDVQTYIGLNIYHVIGLKYQTSKLASYPRNYYRMSSIRALFFLGANVHHRKNTQFYFESGVNDIWLINYANNYETLNLFDYVSHAVGWTYIF